MLYVIQSFAIQFRNNECVLDTGQRQCALVKVMLIALVLVSVHTKAQLFLGC